MTDREEFEKWYQPAAKVFEGLPKELQEQFAALAWESWQAARAADAEPVARHEWDESGERCLKCGDKDWFAGPVCEETKVRTHPPAGSQGVPEGQVMLPREFLQEYLELLDGVQYKEIHKLIRRNAVNALLSTSPGNGWVKDSEKFDVRGFEGLRWKDRYDHSFSIQKSSLATEDCIWFGLDDADPKVLHRDARRLGVDADATCGWVKYPIPDEVSLNTRMHLTREQVAGLLPLLQHFAETGDLPETQTTGESK